MGESADPMVRILVVDSDAQTGKRICEALFQQGWAAQYSASAARARVMARREPPTLMIVEGQLDGCSGYDFAHQVREQNPGQEIPVIFISSAHHDDAAIDLAHRAGGLYHLTKPIDLSVLLELVDKALWMPHLVRGHIDATPHEPGPKAPRLMTDVYATRQSGNW